MVRCLLQDANLPKSFWEEAVLHATYQRNRLPSNANNGKTPYEVFTGIAPILNHIKQFGSKFFIYIDSSQRKSLDNTLLEGIMVGFRAGIRKSRVYFPEQGKTTELQNVVFEKQN